ncbi:MAG: FtsW/RodA/SpoVE family cell cycle protein [Bacteroidales bacterium]|jgi:cell division protein FtsW|nr:FtsW/RodA/SpoVE family cell cycle protein [Bacteroidales bacterium]
MALKITNIFQGNKGIWVIIMFLFIFSEFAVYSASAQLAFGKLDGNTTRFLIKQTIFLLLGVFTIIIVHKIPYKYFSKFSLFFWYVSIILLVFTLIWGADVNDAKRWIMLPGGITFQTSDFAKIALLVYLSKVLAQKEDEINTLKGSMKLVFLPIVITCGLILPAGLSTTVLLFGVCMLLVFMSNMKFRYFANMLGIVLVGGGILIALIFAGVNFGRSDTWKSRIESFFMKDKIENYKENLQETHSKIAVSTGGLFGRGLGHSIQKNILPHPYSDYIFAIIVEELGVIFGAIPLLGCYLYLFVLAIRIVRKANRKFAIYSTISLATLITLQALSNMAVATGIFPVTGQTLPFVSLGGTSIVFTSIAFGIILSVSREVAKEEKAMQNQNEETDITEVGKTEELEINTI